MKRCLSAPPIRINQGPPEKDISPAECRICRRLFASYAADSQKQQSKPAAFMQLVAHDLNVAENHQEMGLCRYHAVTKLRYDMLKYIMRGAADGQRYDALYAEIARIDVTTEKETERYLQVTRDIVSARQEQTLHKVQEALMTEKRSLTDFWTAQVNDLDANITQSINNIQNRQAEELNAEYDTVEKSYEGNRPHFSTQLLELWNQEPRLCKLRAFNQARVIIAQGRLEELKQKKRYAEEIERQKSLRLSWKVNQQMRQLNGALDKMHRHRRKQTANMEEEIGRLTSRVKAAIQRLQRDQRDEIRRLQIFVEQHCYRVRHLVEAHSRCEIEQAERKPLFTARHDVSFTQPVNHSLEFPKSSEVDFVKIILQSQLEDQANTLPPPPTTSQAKFGGRERLENIHSMPRPRTAQGLSQYKTRPHCEWCGRRPVGPPCTLYEEGDAASEILRSMDSFNMPMATVVHSTLNQEPNFAPIPGPRGIPEQCPETARKSRIKKDKISLSTLMQREGPKSPQKKKALVNCCSWKCCHQWNQKYSPPYLRGRRNLMIELHNGKASSSNNGREWK